MERERVRSRTNEAEWQPTIYGGPTQPEPRQSPEEARLSMLERQGRRDRRAIRALQYRVAELELRGQ